MRIKKDQSAHGKDELVFFPTWAAGRPGYADRIRQLFREHHVSKGLRMTQQRNVILDYLLAADHHVDMDEIYGALKSQGIGKVTVFRALKMLEECKLVDRVTTMNGKPRFEVKHERPHHDHLICIQCGTIREIQWPEIERIQERTCKQLGFASMFHRHEIFGRCADCQRKTI